MYAITSTAEAEALTETEASVWFLLQTETAAVLLVCAVTISHEPLGVTKSTRI